MQIDLTDISRVMDRLRGAGKEVTGPGAQRAVRAGAKVIQKAMVERAPLLPAKHGPKSKSLEPGALKGDIRVALVVDNSLPVTAMIGPGGKTAHVARWVEYGHRDVHGGRSKVVGGIGRKAVTQGPGTASEIDVPAHPFLRPAFEESVGNAQKAMLESLAVTLRKEVA